MRRLLEQARLLGRDVGADPRHRGVRLRTGFGLEPGYERLCVHACPGEHVIGFALASLRVRVGRRACLRGFACRSGAVFGRLPAEPSNRPLGHRQTG